MYYFGANCPVLSVLCAQVRELRRQITLDELKGHKDRALSGMALFTTARLSVQPVSKEEWEFVLSLEDQGAEDSSDS